MKRYLHSAIRQLRDQQVRTATPRARSLQADRAEKLLNEVKPTTKYPYEFLWYRVTGYRPENTSGVQIPGETVRHDLRLLVEDLSDSADLHADMLPEPAFTVEEVSRLYNVSTKTVSRWRERGLVSRRVYFNGRKRVGFLKSSLDRFVKKHVDEVRRGSEFSQLTEEEREMIVERARRMAQRGATLSQVSRRLAKRQGRSPETVRYTIREHDRKHPESAVFGNTSGPLSDEAKLEIYREFRFGVSVEALAERFHRTKGSIYRIVNEMRAKRLLAPESDPLFQYMYHESFDKRRAEAEILGPYPEPEVKPRRIKAPRELPPYLASLYEVPLLTKEQEVYLFRKMNYLKHRAAQLRKKLDVSRARKAEMDEIERYLEEALEVKNRIIQANLRLVVSIAKRHVGPANNFFELVSDGNMSLIRAVEKFDFSRGNKFSTYASWAIMKNFARSIPEEGTRRDRFRTGTDELFDISPDRRSDQFEQELQHRRRQDDLRRILDRLDDRERQVIIYRFGLEKGQEPQTLEQVGSQLGVTKERIRQLEARALMKARRFAEEERIDDPAA